MQKNKVLLLFKKFCKKEKLKRKVLSKVHCTFFKETNNIGVDIKRDFFSKRIKTYVYVWATPKTMSKKDIEIETKFINFFNQHDISVDLF